MDPFSGALRSPEQLAELYDPAADRAWAKDVGTLDAVVRRLVAASPLVIVSSHDADGRADASPRGGPPGFVTVLDDGHLAIVVAADEVYAHCPKAFVRSKLWRPGAWPSLDG